MDERRTGWLLIIVLAAQVVLLAVQGARSGSETYLGKVGLRVIGPAARAVGAVSDGVRHLGGSLRLQGSLLSENRRLRREIEDLKLQLLRQGDVDEEMRRLGQAVSYAAPPTGRIRAVDVVYADPSSWQRTLILYSGDQPAQKNQPVLSADGLIGRVVVVAGSYAKVQLITDRAAGVGAMLLRTRRQGVARGSGRERGSLDLDYIPLQAEVRQGDRVVTAGIDGVYPRGIPIGTVTAIEQGGQLFHRIRLIPAVDFGLLDQVYLLEYAPVPSAIKEADPGAHR